MTWVKCVTLEWPQNEGKVFMCRHAPDPTRKLTSLALEKISSQLLLGSWHLCKSSWHTRVKHALLVATRASLMFRGCKSPIPKLTSWGEGVWVHKGTGLLSPLWKMVEFYRTVNCLNAKLCYCRYVEHWLTMKWPEIKEIRVIFKLL